MIFMDTMLRSFSRQFKIGRPYFLLLIILVKECTGHVVLTYPPARKYPLDFMDNRRTRGPCGMPKDTDSARYTDLPAGSDVDLHFHVAYTHVGGVYVDMRDQQNNVVLRHPQSGYLLEDDASASEIKVRLPEAECNNCTLRVVREAREWGNNYLFWSCADVNVKESIPYAHQCSGHGTFDGISCSCDRLYSGDRCQFKDECMDNSDCSNNGQCIDTEATKHPRFQCFCNPGWFGRSCEKESAIKSRDDINMDLYMKRSLDDTFHLYHRILPETQEVEVIMKAESTTWVATGWRAPDTSGFCRRFPTDSSSKEYFKSQPTGEPTGEPHPSGEPTGEPTHEPHPSGEPTHEPHPSGEPTHEPHPSGEPTHEPHPSGEPTHEPHPSGEPTHEPHPSGEPTHEPHPSGEPTHEPHPSGEPTHEPHPSGEPTHEPHPSGEPTHEPHPSGEPTHEPHPSGEPTHEPNPSGEPTHEPHPSGEPTHEPHPSGEPTHEPHPSGEPTGEPAGKSTKEPEPTLCRYDCGEDCLFQTVWVINAQNRSVLFNLQLKLEDNEYFGIGWSKDRFMAESDIYIGYMNADGSLHMSDRWASFQSDPEVDDHNDVYPISSINVDNDVTAIFIRELNSGDQQDVNIADDDCVYIITAKGTMSENTIDYQGGSKQVSSGKFCFHECLPPTAQPTHEPTGEPTGEPRPSGEPTGEPRPSGEPTGEPRPSGEPTGEPNPSGEPTGEPRPSGEPTGEPHPSGEPTGEPRPSGEPTGEPHPSGEPTGEPRPSGEPTGEPRPSGEPTGEPHPSGEPTHEPSHRSTVQPGFRPTVCHYDCGSDCLFDVKWSITAEYGLATFTVMAPIADNEYFAVGWSKDNKMPESDIYIGYIKPDGSLHMMDTWASARSRPLEDSKRDVKPVAGIHMDNKAEAVFVRELETGDSKDINLAGHECVYILTAMGSVSNDGMISYHKARQVSTQKFCFNQCMPKPPTPKPTGEPTGEPTGHPTGEPHPSGEPTGEPHPSGEPTGEPHPSGEPTGEPHPSGEPTGEPHPSGEPTGEPHPSGEPTGEPHPSGEPTGEPHPSGEPTGEPHPSGEPTGEPHPSGEPTGEPHPSGEPTGEPHPSGSTSEPRFKPTVCHYECGKSCQFDLKWTITSEYGLAAFTVEADIAENEYFAVGWSKDEHMAESDIAVGYINPNGSLEMMDMWAYAQVRPREDQQNDITSVAGIRMDNRVEAVFIRYLDTGDTVDDVNLSGDDCFYILTAKGPVNDGIIEYHSYYSRGVSDHKICFNQCVPRPPHKPTGEPTGEPTHEPHPSGEPTHEPHPSGEPTHEPTGEPSGEPTGEPSGEPTGEPSGEPTGEPSGEPTGEPSGEPTGASSGSFEAGSGIHPMDCTDIVVGAARGQLSRIGDYYTRDRSTPLMDEEYGGVFSLTSAFGYEEDGMTTILFRKKLEATDSADWSIRNEIMHVIWARGQAADDTVHRPDSAYERDLLSDKDYYKPDELKYHGHGNHRGAASFNFFESPKGNEGSGDCMSGGCSSPACPFDLMWRYNQQDNTVIFNVSAEMDLDQWVALGFSYDAKMAETDVIAMWMEEALGGEVLPVISDRYARGHYTPEEDVANSDVMLIGGRRANGISSFTFKRAAVTQDEDDVDFHGESDLCPHVFYAQGGKHNNGNLEKHIRTPVVRPRTCFGFCDDSQKRTPEPTTPERTTPPPQPTTKAPKSVNVQIPVSLKLTQEFTPELADKSSRQYNDLKNDLEEDLTNTMSAEFGDALDRVEVTDMRQGSIIVDFDVYLSSTDDEVNDVANTMEATVEDIVNTGSLDGKPLDTTFSSVAAPIISPADPTTTEDPGDGVDKDDDDDDDSTIGKVEVIIIACAAGLVFVALIVLFCKLWESKNNKRNDKNGSSSNSSSQGKQSFDFDGVRYQEFLNKSQEVPKEKRYQETHVQQVYDNPGYDAPQGPFTSTISTTTIP